MHFRSIRSTAMTLAVALPLAACGSDKVTGVELTQVQVEDLIDALAAVSSDGTGFTVAARAAYAGGDVAPVTLTIDDTSPCPQGGTTRVTGTVTFDETATGATIGANVAQSYSSCAATSPRAVTWTFNGAPGIQQALTGSANFSTGDVTLQGTQTGTFSFSSPSGSGSCTLNLNLSFTGNENTGAAQATLTGTACGRTVNRTFTS